MPSTPHSRPSPPRRMPALLLLLIFLVVALAVPSVPVLVRSAAAAPHMPDVTASSLGAEVLVPTVGGSPGGVWHYQPDSGWTLKHNGLPAGQPWQWIATDPFNRDRWLLLAGGRYGYYVANNGYVMQYGGTVHPLWLTVDAGATWQPVPLAAGTSTTYIFDRVEFDPTTPGDWRIIGRDGSDQAWAPNWLWRGHGATSGAPTQLISTESCFADFRSFVPGTSGDTVIYALTPVGCGLVWQNRGLGYVRSGESQIRANHPLLVAVSPASSPQLQIERLPGDSPAVVGVNTNPNTGAGTLWGSPDYHATQVGLHLDGEQGRWVTAATSGVYLGGRTTENGMTGGVLQVTDVFGTPTNRVIGPTSGAPIGFVRADRQTRTAVAARVAYSVDSFVSADGRTWTLLPGPPGLAWFELADRLEVIAGSRAAPSLNLNLDAPASLAVVNYQYAPNPFTITATVGNSGPGKATNVQLTLSLPGGLSLVAASPTKPVGDIDVDEQRLVTWQVLAAAQPRQAWLFLSVSAMASNAPSIAVGQSITIPVLVGPLPPRYTTSYYEGTVDQTVHRKQGCQARAAGNQGIIVLDYGSPRDKDKFGNPIYGAGLIRPDGAETPDPVTIDDIKKAAQAFADGYYRYQSCSQFGIKFIEEPVAPDLVLAVGISNSNFKREARVGTKRIIYHILNPALTRSHGVEWAKMVRDLQDEFLRRGYTGVSAAGAYDAEPNWWYADRDGKAPYNDEELPDATFAWARGFDSVSEVMAYYNFGSIDGGPRTASWIGKPNDLKLDRVYELSWGIRSAFPLPQIYNDAYAKEWYQLRRYSFFHGGRYGPLIIAGTMTEYLSSGHSDVDILFEQRGWQEFKLDFINLARVKIAKSVYEYPIIEDFAPRQGWQALYDALHRTLIVNLTLSANLGAPLPDTFLVAPSTKLTIPRKAGCQPTYLLYDYIKLKEPNNRLARQSCLPAGTTFPADSTFPATFVLPASYHPVFSVIANQSLRWSTDIRYGAY